jgi:hypothetical protein
MAAAPKRELRRNTTYSAAKIRSASFDADANTIEVVWSTGADVVRDDYDGQYVERLLMGEGNVRLGRLNSGAPLLDSHRSDGLANVIGKVVEGSAKIEDGRGTATVLLSSASADADAILKIRDGVIKNISVGYWIHKSNRIEGDKGQFAVTEVTDWEPMEISAVPIGADAGAQIRSANSRLRPRARQTPAQRAASYTHNLLTQSTQTRGQAHGAAEARKALGTIGRMETVAKVGKIDKRDVDKGAREARKLLGGRK